MRRRRDGRCVSHGVFDITKWRSGIAEPRAWDESLHKGRMLGVREKPLPTGGRNWGRGWWQMELRYLGDLWEFCQERHGMFRSTQNITTEYYL